MTVLTNAQLDEAERLAAAIPLNGGGRLFRALIAAFRKQQNEYDKWICELEGPTPAELIEQRDAARAEVEHLKAQFELHRQSIEASHQTDIDEVLERNEILGRLLEDAQTKIDTLTRQRDTARAEAERFLTQAHNAEGALITVQAEIEKLRTVAEAARLRGNHCIRSGDEHDRIRCVGCGINEALAALPDRETR